MLELLPEALLVRTSAFFGPWDDHNFATLLLRALEAGRRFDAPADCVVSPTYVPHLVQASLELLIDGERGIWHLANDGARSWLDFGRELARAARLDETLVNPCRALDIWRPAARPAYTALASARGWIMPPLATAVDSYLEDFGRRRELELAGRELA